MFYVFLVKPMEDISCVAWNKQVQHILASASPGGRASVWDLRKNDLIIKVSDHSNRVRCQRNSQHVAFSPSPLALSTQLKQSQITVACFFPDALFWLGLEPRGGHSAGLGFGGRQDARHPDVGLTICYLSSQDSRASLKVRTDKSV